MKNLSLSFLLIFCISLALSQEVIYTISASKEDQTTHLDSILFENLNNQTKFVVGNLPVLPAYEIDLTSQLLVTHVEQVGLPFEEVFRLIRNTPGEVSVQYSGKMLENVILSIYNMAGQRMFTQNVPVLSQNEVLNVSIPSSGIYLLSINSSHGSVNYKAIGSAENLQGTYNLSTVQQPAQNINAAPIATTLKSSPLSDGFSYQIGDSIKVSVFLNDYYSNPHLGRIVDSNHIQFEMHKDNNENTGYFVDTRDGQIYKWAKIGNQIWMAENLNFVTANSRCYPHSDFNCDRYGQLYNWYDAMNGASSSRSNPSGVQGVCPPGWHIPSHDEWTQLEQYICNSLGNSGCEFVFPYNHATTGYRGTNEGNALKSCRQVNSPLGGECNTSIHPRWLSNDHLYGTDTYGFSALPGGMSYNRIFDVIGSRGYWWSATEYSNTHAWSRGIFSYDGLVGRYDSRKDNGYSVRCVRYSDIEADSHTLNLLVSPPGSGSVQGSGEFRAGEQISITATANTEWEFVKWSDSTGKVVATTAVHDFIMPANNVTLIATFREENENQIVEVLNPATGNVWMDRNLGASRAATSSTDEEAYGDLYQWGRASDGHQKRTSGTTSTLSSSDTPGHGNFITVNGYPYDWRSEQNTNLWQGIFGVNNPCPTGYRLPTDAELNAERQSWSSLDAAGAFASPLKLTVAGYRSFSSESLYDVGFSGNYWSSTVGNTESRHLRFTTNNAYTYRSSNRANGYSVRCLKNYSAILNIDVSPTGAGEVYGSNAYEVGEAASINARANVGWAFENWIGNTEYVDDPMAANTTVTMPAYDITLTAIFRASPEHQVIVVINPTTGKTWMDRNLGASRAANSVTDEEAYGDLYQWGRASDGHQKRTSGTTSARSSSNTPRHGNFITSSCDWRSPQNNNLWLGVNGVNNPCPPGYRLPTAAELDTERLSWSSNNSAGAFASPLKLPVAGRREYSDGSLGYMVGFGGYYWSSTVDGGGSSSLYFRHFEAKMQNNTCRAYGFSIRCLKDDSAIPDKHNLNIDVHPAGAGNVSAVDVYNAGDAISISAVSNAGWTFVEWTGDTDYIDDPMAANTTGTMPDYDITLAANFEEVDDDWPRDTQTNVVAILNPATGKVWMDRNLGASRAATSSTDAQAYGDLYQWGRAADGHQKRNSGTTSTLSGSDTPGHGNFILAPNSPYDWRIPQNNHLWQGMLGLGLNNPCPPGYRLPTEAELNAERLSWSSNNRAGAFASPLKLLIAGVRDASNGSLYVGSSGGYWSSTVGGVYSRYLGFGSGVAGLNSYGRARGFSVRCLKNDSAIPSYHNLNIDVSPAGAGEVSGADVYEAGEVVSIEAVANTGWAFVEWTGDTDYVDDPAAANATVAMPAYDITLMANYTGVWPRDIETTVVDVTNPATGKTWMDRNLGASRAATSSADAEAYGDLYQWGRAADGHQKRNSGTTSTLSGSDTPGHGNFITNSGSNPYDWRSPQNTNLWQGVNGVNNPCPPGYRLPTDAELDTEHLSWSSNNSAGAFASPLKLPVAGNRISYGSLRDVGSYGSYWSSTVDGIHSLPLLFSSGIASMYGYFRADGLSVRCFKD